jgi:diguanylate cyclase (GGDEF)-like protein
VAAVLPLFDVEPEPTAVPVLSGTRTVGLVTKHLLFFHLGHQFGYSLLRDRPVGRFLAEFGGGYDAIAASGSIEEAAEVVRRRPPGRRFDPVIVESEMGDYLGILPVDLLLAEMTRLKVDYALQSNPLTRLPGTQVLARTVDAWRARERPFCLGWADLDDFKPFNDRYGFARGDDVLLLAARTLRDRLVSSPDEVLAHPGGDDFAFVISPEAAEVLARRAAEEFSRDVLALYDEDDRRQGGIVSVDRRGERRTFGFVSISIGLVLWDGRAEVDTRRLVEVAAEVKTVAKGTPGVRTGTGEAVTPPGMHAAPRGPTMWAR